MKRPLVLVLAATTLAAAVVLLVLFAMGLFDSVDPEPATPRSRETSSATLIEPSEAPAPRPRTDSPAETIAAPGAAAASAMPEPYRKALSGVTGRVVESDGTPLPGFVVTLLELRFGPVYSSLGESFDPTGPPPHFEIGEAVTGEDGRFLIGGAIGWALHGLGVNLGGPRGTLRVIDREFPRGTVVDVGDIVLSPNLVFTGRVVDEGGSPVAGARVRATSAPAIIFQGGVEHVRPTSRLIGMYEEKTMVFEIPDWILAYEKKLPVPTATTDENGRYRLEGIPRGLVSVAVDREGFVALAVPSIPSGDGKERELEPFVLTRGRTIRGRVVDSAGRPVAGAEVIGGAVVPVGYAAIAKSASERTGADGRFEIPHVPVLGAAAVAARTARHTPWKVLGPTYDDENAEIVLDDAATLVVRLRGVLGDVVPRAEIRLRPWVEDVGSFPLVLSPYIDAGGQVRTVAGEEGTLAIDGVRPGRYELIGRAPGRGFAKADVKFAPAEGTGSEVTLEFPAGREIAVTVLDDATGAPIEWATVSAVTVPMEMHSIDRRRTGADGKCTLSAIPIVTAGADAVMQEGAEALMGLVRIVAEHPAYARFVVDVDTAAGETEIVARLVAGGAFAGRVHDGGAIPEKPVMVTLSRPDEMSAGPDAVIPRMTIADLEGKFRIANLEPGEYRYEVMDRFLDGDPLEFIMKSMTLDTQPRTHASDNVTIVAGQTTEIEVDIDIGALGPTAFLRGIVTVNGEPLRNGLLSFWREGLRSSFRATTDERGEFLFGEVPAGVTQIGVVRRNADPESGGNSHENIHSLKVDLLPGEDRYLEIHVTVLDVTVLVLDPDGGPVSGARVTLSDKSDAIGRSHRFGSTNSEGRARLTVGAPGEFVVSAEREGHGRAIRDAEVTGSQGPIVVELERGVVFSGTVTFEEGVGPTEQRPAWVFIRHSVEGRQVDQQTASLDSESHAFEFTNVLPGRYTMMVYVGDGWSQESAVEIPPGGLTGFSFEARPALRPDEK